MADPLRIRFATDSAPVKAAMQDLAASVVSNMVKVSGAVAGNSATAAAGAKKLADTLAMLASSPLFFNAAIAGGGILALVGVFSVVTAAAERAEARMKGVLKVANGAEDAGVGTSFFQRWLGEAQSLNLEVGKLEGMLKSARAALTDKIGEGDESASTSSAGNRIRQNVLAGNLGQDALTRFNAVGDQESRIRVVLDLLDELKAKGANLAAFDLAGKVFGEDFERKMRAGVDIVGEMKKTLDDVAATSAKGDRILSPREIEQARALKATLEETHKILADAMAPIQRDLAAYQAQQAQSAAEFNRTLAEAVASVAQIYGWFTRIGAAIEQLGNLSIWKKISDLSDRLGLSNYRGIEMIDPSTGKVIQQEVIKASGSGGIGGSIAARVTAQPTDTSRSLPSLGPKNPAGGPSESQDQVESYIQSLARSTAALKAEAEAYGLSGAEKQKAIVLARAEEIAKQRGSALTEEEIAKLTAVGTAAGTARDKIAELQQQSQQAAEAMRALGDAAVDSLYGMIVDGKSAADVMQDLTRILIKAALQAAIMGTGPLAGLFGTAPAPGATGASSAGGLIGAGVSLFKLFGFSEGGYTGDGGKYEPAGIVHAGEYVIPAEIVRAIGVDRLDALASLPGFAVGGLVGRAPGIPNLSAAGGGSISIDLGRTSIDARGSTMSEGQMLALVDQRDRALKGQLAGMIRDLVTRGALR